MQEIIQKCFSIDSNTYATLFITLLIFALGYLLTALAFLINKYLERKEIRKIVKENVLLLTVSLKKQEDALLELSVQQEVFNEALWTFVDVGFYQIRVFDEIGYKESFKAFFNGIENYLSSHKALKRKTFSELWAKITIIESFVTNRSDSRDLNVLNEHHSKRNEAMERLRKCWENLLIRIPSNTIELQYLTSLLSVVNNYASTPTRQRVNPFFTHRKLVLPIRILNKRFMNQLDVRSFTDICLEVSHHYLNIENTIRNAKYQTLMNYNTYKEMRLAFEEFENVF